MSLLKVYESDILESQNNYDSYCNSLLLLEGDFLPAWYFTPSRTYTTAQVVLQTLDKVSLSNKVISAIETKSLPVYSLTIGTNIWAERIAETLENTKVYRLQLVMYVGAQGYPHYSEIFKKL